MALVKVRFRPSSAAAKEGVLCYQIVHDKQTRQLRTEHKLHSREWDPRSCRIILSAGIDACRKEYLISLRETVSKETGKLSRIIERCESSGELYTADKVAEKFRAWKEAEGFLSFARQLIIRLGEFGRNRLAESYRTSLNSLIRFRGEGEIPFEEFDSALTAGYQAWLKSHGLCPNSISYYMRNLRAIYNRAAEKNLVLQAYPFKHVYTGVEKTLKRAVSLQVIRLIRDLDLKEDSSAELARDLFLFSFYTRGMSFVDMAYLRKRDLSDGVLTYRRRKTGQKLCIKWEKPMQEIIDRYDTSSTPYLLPIISCADKSEHRQYLTVAHMVNKKLHMIGERLGLYMPLTSYVARHAWASIALCENVPVSTISEAMGHDSEYTTRIYLASLDTSKVDKANSRILNALNKKPQE